MSTNGPTLTDGTISIVPTYTFNTSNQLTIISALATTTSGTIDTLTITGPTGSSSGTLPTKVLTLTTPSVGPFTITYSVTTSTTISIANGASRSDSNRAIAYTAGTSALVVGMPIKFNITFGSITAGTQYYVGTGTTSTLSGTYSGVLYISSTSNGSTLITLTASPSSTTTGTVGNSYITKVAGYNLEADFLFVDTLVCPTLIVFPNPLTNTTLLTNKAIFVKDTSWKAGTNNITLQAIGGARIEDRSQIILNQNGECISIFTNLSQYYISSLYPSKNCGLMATLDSTNSYNLANFKANAVADRVNIFNTDNTPPFNPDGSINTNPSTTQRESNQNIVVLPIPTQSSMCMVIYAGGLSGRRHTYPLAFHCEPSIVYTTSVITTSSNIISYTPTTEFATGSIVYFSTTSTDLKIIANTPYYVHSSSTGGSLIISLTSGGSPISLASQSPYDLSLIHI